jgi:hypothetical protein
MPGKIDLTSAYWAAALSIPAAVLLASFLRAEREPGHPIYYSAWDSPPKLQKRGARAEAKALFLERLKHYYERCEALTKNTYSWVLLVGLTILILTRGGKEGFQIFGITIPPGATHALVVASMFYLWMDFGVTLKFLIYERMALWKLVDHIEGRVGPEKIVELGSLRPMLYGKGFLDGWFVTFLPEYTLRWKKEGLRGTINNGLNVGLWVAAAGMIGLAHACPFVLLWDVGMLWGASHEFVGRFVPVAQTFILAVIILCYLYFYVERHGTWFFIVCSFAAAIAILYLPDLTALRGAAPRSHDSNAPGAAASASASARASPPPRPTSKPADSQPASSSPRP